MAEQAKRGSIFSGVVAATRTSARSCQCRCSKCRDVNLARYQRQPFRVYMKRHGLSKVSKTIFQILLIRYKAVVIACRHTRLPGLSPNHFGDADAQRTLIRSGASRARQGAARYPDGFQKQIRSTCYTQIGRATLHRMSKHSLDEGTERIPTQQSHQSREWIRFSPLCLSHSIFKVGWGSFPRNEIPSTKARISGCRQNMDEGTERP